MANLITDGSLGNTSTSALFKSASSLASANQTYEDNVAAYNFENDVYADPNGAFATYQAYLQGRISTLTTLGGPTNGSKAITLSNTLTSAQGKSVSTAIAQENIQVLAGNATTTDKYNLVVSEFARAQATGDVSLTQSLESQAYTLSKQIQYEAQQSSAAATTLQTANVTHQADIVTALTDSIKNLNSAAKNQTEVQFNKDAQAFVHDPANTAALKSLGVVLPANAAPNYFDIVSGIATAQYNALVLKAQAESPLDPMAAQNYAQDAADLSNGTTTIDTLGGHLTIQQIQEAAQSPNMFAYDNTTGTYNITTQTGYQYQTFTNAQGQSYKAVVPTYSGYADGKIASKFFFLTPNQTAQVTALGLNIDATVTASGPNKGTVGSGIKVQATNNTPAWLTAIIGQKGVEQVFNQNGQISFKAGDTFYTIAQDLTGKSGLVEHNPDGTTKLVGGTTGFNQNDLGLTLNSQGSSSPSNLSFNLKSDSTSIDTIMEKSAQLQALTLANNKAAQAMLALPPPPLPNISIAPPAPTPAISQPPKVNPLTVPTAVNTPTVNPQTPAPVNLQGGNVNLQGGGGIKL